MVHENKKWLNIEKDAKIFLAKTTVFRFFCRFCIIPVIRGKGDDTSTGRAQWKDHLKFWNFLNIVVPFTNESHGNWSPSFSVFKYKGCKKNSLNFINTVQRHGTTPWPESFSLVYFFIEHYKHKRYLGCSINPKTCIV